MKDRRRTRTQDRHLKRMVDTLTEEMTFFQMSGRFIDLVPKGWDDVPHDNPPRPKKTKITIRLDEEVVKWFRHVGIGYQKRMNDVLRCYMDAVISKYIEDNLDRSVDGRPI